MTAPVHDDTVGWFWATTVASIAAPTVANITAATRIPAITNYTLNNSEAEVDTSDIDSTYDTSVVGTSKSGPITLTIKRDDTDESDTWDLMVFRQTGYLIRSPFAPTPVATDKVEVYPAQIGQRRPSGYGRNAVQTFDVTFYVTAEPDLDAVVAA
jgi:hypothetical protein